MSEHQLLKQVIQLARLCGWRTAHFRPARTKDGWRTAVDGDGVGWPDLVLVRGDTVLFVELKRDGKKPTPEQLAWLDALRGAGLTVLVWMPADWPEIQATLMGDV